MNFKNFKIELNELANHGGIPMSNYHKICIPPILRLEGKRINLQVFLLEDTVAVLNEVKVATDWTYLDVNSLRVASHQDISRIKAEMYKVERLISNKETEHQRIIDLKSQLEEEIEYSKKFHNEISKLLD